MDGTKTARAEPGAENRHRALYVRVSTEAQAEEGYSVAAQTLRLQAYCDAMGWLRRELYEDAGFSGSNLERPQMRRLIEDVRGGRVRTVLVYKLDRLSRSQKDTLYLIEDVFLPNDVDFVSLNENIDTSTPYGRAMVGILSAFAQLERENIFMRTRMGMLERVKQGYWMGGGGVPFGYDYDREKGILIPNADAPLVRRIYELYIDGYSPQAIANRLGLRYEKLVTQILTRRSNLGLISYKGKEYRGRHEPIVSRELFEQAQRCMRDRAKGARASGENVHLLTGLIYCGECSARMRYVKWGRAGYRLRCYSKDSSKPYMRRTENCPSQAVEAGVIEQTVVDDLLRLSVDLEKAAAGGRLNEDPARDMDARIERERRKLRRLYELYAGGDDVLLEAINRLRQSILAMEKDRNSLEAMASETERLRQLESKVAGLSGAWEYMTDREKQTVIRECVEKVVITGEKAEIFYKFNGHE